jgi:NAD(P)H-hydrate epimerase
MPPFTLSREQVRELDRRAIEEFGVPSIVLMENAGRGCAELLMQLNPNKEDVLVLCGPGNNGGDGFVLARHLDNHCWPVTVILIGDPKRLSRDAASNWVPIKLVERAFASPDTKSTDIDIAQCLHEEYGPKRRWIVDALFGTGLNRPLAPPFDHLVEVVNRCSDPILAVDLPSGLDCDTGEPLGPTVRATHTATFVAPKKGFLNPKSKEWTGEVHVIDIGAPRVLVEQYRG